MVNVQLLVYYLMVEGTKEVIIHFFRLDLITLHNLFCYLLDFQMNFESHMLKEDEIGSPGP